MTTLFAIFSAPLLIGVAYLYEAVTGREYR